MPADPAHQFNRLACQADFTYTMTVNTIKIQDTGKGAKSVAEGPGSGLAKDRDLQQGPIAGFRIVCRDSDGYWDGVRWNGQQAAFFALQEKSETAAEKKLLASQSKIPRNHG